MRQVPAGLDGPDRAGFQKFGPGLAEPDERYVGRDGPGGLHREDLVQGLPVEHAEGAAETVAVDRRVVGEPEVEVDDETPVVEQRDGRLAEGVVQIDLVGERTRLQQEARQHFVELGPAEPVIEAVQGPGGDAGERREASPRAPPVGADPSRENVEELHRQAFVAPTGSGRARVMRPRIDETGELVESPARRRQKKTWIPSPRVSIRSL